MAYSTKASAMHPHGVTHVVHSTGPATFGYMDRSNTRTFLSMGIVCSLATIVLLAIATGTGSWAWSNNGTYMDFHIGLWTACGYSPTDTNCIYIRNDAPFMDDERYRRLQAMRALMIIATSFMFTAACAAALATVRSRPPTATLVPSLLLCLLACACGIVSVTMWADLQDDGFGSVAELQYGWSFVCACVGTAAACLSALPFAAAMHSRTTTPTEVALLSPTKGTAFMQASP